MIIHVIKARSANMKCHPDTPATRTATTITTMAFVMNT